MYRHGKKRKRNGGELKSIDQIASRVVQNEKNTRDADFLVKSLLEEADLATRQANRPRLLLETGQSGKLRLPGARCVAIIARRLTSWWPGASRRFVQEHKNDDEHCQEF